MITPATAADLARRLDGAAQYSDGTPTRTLARRELLHEAANVLEDMAVIATELADYLSYRDGLMLPPRLQTIVNEWRKPS